MLLDALVNFVFEFLTTSTMGRILRPKHLLDQGREGRADKAVGGRAEVVAAAVAGCVLSHTLSVLGRRSHCLSEAGGVQ